MGQQLKQLHDKIFRKLHTRLGTHFIGFRCCEKEIFLFFLIFRCPTIYTESWKRLSMKSLEKLRVPHFMKRVSLLLAEVSCGSSKPLVCVNGSCSFLQQRLSGTASAVDLKSCANLGELAKKSRLVRTAAQAALFDYFHTTRGLQTVDAENMSKDTPEFFDSLAKRVDVDDGNAGRSVARFLRYHPVNEFEPFFESIGLRPCEYVSFIPRGMMFLNEDELLLENYYVLCEYGVARKWIGRIYKEATEVFQYKNGVLRSKLRSLEKLGLKQSVVAKIAASTPQLLRGDVVDQDFVEALSKLKKVGIEFGWLEEHLSVEDSYNWECIHERINLLSQLGLSEEQIGELLGQCPHLLLECSGRITFSLFGFLLKFGSRPTDVQKALLQFPQISVSKFITNLHNSYKFLTEINMAVEDIGWVVRSHPILLGSHEIKKASSLLVTLRSGKQTLCDMIKNDPWVLTKWTRGVGLKPLHKERKSSRARMIKTNFLLSIGFVEKSEEMEKAFRGVRGKVEELQERFDYLVNLGLSREEVLKIVKTAPQVLNQSKDVVATKVGFYVKDLGLQVSDLLGHPKLVSYTIERVKLRLAMYDWLKKEGVVNPNLSLSSVLSISDKEFKKAYVNCHSGGLQHWQSLQKEIYSEENN